MKLVISLLLAALVGVSSALSKVGYKDPLSLTFQTLPDLPTTNIVGGTIAPAGRYPYIAALFFSTSSTATPGCGGTLIAPNVVLTAAHCAGSVRVRMGCYTISSGCPETFSISQEILHPNFNSNTLNNDFNILILSGSSAQTPIAFLADASYASSFTSGVDLTVMGWGTTSSGGAVSNTLREVVVDALTNAECLALYNADSPNLILSSMLCAARAGKDSCQGDSGGPLIVKCDATGQDLLAGTVSWGFGCADAAFPGVYGRVSVGISFVTSTLAARGITLPTPPAIGSLCSGSTTPAPVAAPVDTPGTAYPTPFPNLPPSSWSCPTAYYNTLDGCDCSYCGDVDPDCLTPSQFIYGCGGSATSCNIETNTCVTGRRALNLRAEVADKIAAKLAGKKP